jgi:hypothetical protein
MAHRPADAATDIPTSANLAVWLERYVPAARQHVAALREKVAATAPAQDRAALVGNPYTLLSEAFFRPVCVPVIESGTSEERAHLARLVERLLTTPDRALTEAVLIRVVEPLTDDPSFWAVLAPHAGPNLRWAAERH